MKSSIFPLASLRIARIEKAYNLASQTSQKSKLSIVAGLKGAAGQIEREIIRTTFGFFATGPDWNPETRYSQIPTVHQTQQRTQTRR